MLSWLKITSSWNSLSYPCHSPLVRVVKMDPAAKKDTEGAEKNEKSFLFISFSLFFSLSSAQTIIPNLTTYSVYTVNVQAATLSAINSRRILLGSHSASRKVNAN